VPTDYRISALSVNAFRGLKVIQVSLPSRMPAVLIGSNKIGDRIFKWP
jgi:hypothetical protein